MKNISLFDDFAEMLALQKFAVDYVSKNIFLQRLIESGKFKFYVTNRVHAKIYLMQKQMKFSEIKKFVRISFTDDKNFLQKFLSLFNRN